MITTVWNPVSDSLDLEISVNGEAQTERIPPDATARFESELPAERTITIKYRGARQLVLIETDFR
jgi:hypothetical protein